MLGFYREVRMRFHARVSLLALLAGAIVALSAPAAAQAALFNVGAEESSSNEPSATEDNNGVDH